MLQTEMLKERTKQCEENRGGGLRIKKNISFFVFSRRTTATRTQSRLVSIAQGLLFSWYFLHVPTPFVELARPSSPRRQVEGSTSAEAIAGAVAYLTIIAVILTTASTLLQNSGDGNPVSQLAARSTLTDGNPTKLLAAVL